VILIGRCHRHKVARRIVGDGPAPQAAFDAEVLGAIGIDQQTVRQSVEKVFGDSVAVRILDAHAISPERLRAALGDSRHAPE
jgi:hypothetical protein